MHVLTYSADDEADNVYLSLLDIVSIEERQVKTSATADAKKRTTGFA